MCIIIRVHSPQDPVFLCVCLTFLYFYIVTDKSHAGQAMTEIQLDWFSFHSLCKLFSVTTCIVRLFAFCVHLAGVLGQMGSEVIHR